MLRQALLATAVVLLGSGQSGVAQEPTPSSVNMHPNPTLLQRSAAVRMRDSVPISLQEALDLAKRYNPQLRSAKFHVERSRAQLQEAQSEALPRLRMQGNLNQR